LRYLRPGSDAFDDILLRLAREFVNERSVVWDVGANVGAFSAAAAAKGADVLAIEPDPFLYGLLDATQQHRGNAEMKLQPLCAAVSSAPGMARLAIAKRGRASNFLEDFGGRSQTGGTRRTRLVPVVTLDLLLKDMKWPTLLKIDVEGAELAVLEGAQIVLREARPVILVEIGQHTWRDVYILLARNRYSVTDFGTGAKCSETTRIGSNWLATPQ
jgi:FkbM family methyltransferase